MIVGGELDDPEYIEIIEEQGGLVVTDSTCFGSRLMWRPVDEAEKDPIRALARYYVADRPSCPRMYGDQPKRISYTREMIKEFRVDGVIGERLLFCDQWVIEHYMTTQDLKKDDIPFLTARSGVHLERKGPAENQGPGVSGNPRSDEELDDGHRRGQRRSHWRATSRSGTGSRFSMRPPR